MTFKGKKFRNNLYGTNRELVMHTSLHSNGWKQIISTNLHIYPYITVENTLSGFLSVFQNKCYLFYLSGRYLLSICYIPDIVLDTGKRMENKIITFLLWSLILIAYLLSSHLYEIINVYLCLCKKVCEIKFTPKLVFFFSEW